jgi:hypothetical protein
VVIGTLAIFTWIILRRRSVVSTRPKPLALTAEGGGAARPAYFVVVTPQSVTGSAAGEIVVSSTSRPRGGVPAPAVRRSADAPEDWQHHAQNAGPHPESAAAMRDGLFTHLSHWLKEKLVRRLIADRAQLLAMQEAAARKTLAMDERLARVERQIQQQNQAYEQRIIDLTRELDAAREGNRELIQAQIAKVKAEMEAARARLRTEAQTEV